MNKIFFLLCLSTIIIGCQREPVQVGTIDNSKLIVNEDLESLSWEGIADKYLGKVITVTNLMNNVWTQKLGKQRCNHAYYILDGKNGFINNISIHVPFNYQAYDISGLIHVEDTTKTPSRSIEIDPMGSSEPMFRADKLCDPKACENEDYSETCIWKSKTFKITGRVVSILPRFNSRSGEFKYARITLYPLGYEY